MSLAQDRVMIFHPSENGRFIKKTAENSFYWTGEFIGEVSGMLNEIPSVKGNKLYYLSPANQYVILQKYDTKTHIIELIKRIYELPMIPYNLCYFKNKQYIMYSYTPFNEIEYTLWQRKKEEITDGERLLFFFHWMLGIKGKVIRAYTDCYSGGSVIMSNGKYSVIDYNNTDMTQAKINKYFGTYRSFQNTAMFFNRLEKIDAIRSVMNHENYWWFQEIERRIRGNVISQQPIPYSSTPQKSQTSYVLGISNFQYINNTDQSQIINDSLNAIPYHPTHNIQQNNNTNMEKKEEKIISNKHYSNETDIPISPNTRYALFQQPKNY